jgi:hypothetical protein
MGLEDMPTTVGYVTTATGVALVLAPGVAARQMGLAGQEGPLRLIGAADLVLVPGLLRGKPRWPWMIARAGMNLAMAAYFLGVGGKSREARVTGYVLMGLTVVDCATGVTLSRRTPAD